MVKIISCSVYGLEEVDVMIPRYANPVPAVCTERALKKEMIHDFLSIEIT
uniref:Uncharacterized protein n=1 Tax=Arundo donax TaxID=35708 RepID=A0A0A8YKM6_ARUDO